MKCVDLSQTFRIYYKTNALATGQNVVFNVWNHNGIQLTTNLQGTEIGTDGVYYIQYRASSSSGYLLITGSNNGNSLQADVVEVGGPSKKAWYVNGRFSIGQIIPYEIYDATGNAIVSGTLTNVASGFYNADVEGLPEPWFFEVYPGVKRPTECIAP